MKTIFIIAGETSGDLHGANLVKELKKINSNLIFRGIGGDKMKSQNVKLITHINEINFMGFTEVLKNLGKIYKLMKKVKKDIKKNKPDLVILIDYPGFNLRLTSFLKKNNIKICYYISPQIWAWKQSRIHQIRKNINLMIVILPFEEKFYQDLNFKVYYVGHPLLDSLPTVKKDRTYIENKKVIALLPGSREQEIKKNLPIMIRLLQYDQNNEFHFIIAGTSSVPKNTYINIINKARIDIWYNKTYELFQIAHFGIITSGTATLEAALMEVPQICCYIGNTISFYLAKKLIQVKYISLVNLILDKPAIPELIQNDFNSENTFNQMKKILDTPELLNKQNLDYTNLKSLIGQPGASMNAAKLIIEKFFS